MYETSHTDWNTIFRNRLHTLPLEYEVLNAELCEVSRAYEVFCTDLNERLESLRHKRTVTAASLPAEILLLIFSELTQDEPLGEMCGCVGELTDYESTDDGKPITDDGESTEDDESLDVGCPAHPASAHRDRDCYMIPGLGWSRVSHVCSHWRAVATENATLWTTISLNLCTPWLEEAILRSKYLPLDIVIPCDANWDAVNEILPDCLARVRSIDAERVTDIVQALLSTHSTPLLEYLDVDHHMTLFNAGASYPRLKHFSLTSAYSLPNLHGLADSQITHLAILSVVTVPLAKQLRDLLQFLKGVHYLHLENCLPAGSEDISTQPVVLSRLETLILRGQASSCGALMRSIKYSPSASTTLYYIAPDEPQVTNTPDYMHRSGLAMLLQNTASTVFHSLHVSCVEIHPQAWQLIVAGQRDPCQISDYMCDYTHAETAWTGPSFQDLKIVCMLHGYDSPHTLALGLFTQIMANLPTSSLSMLSLNVDALLRLDADPWNHARWLSVLKDAEEVEHLQLISSSWRILDTTKHAQPSPYVDLLVALSISMGPSYSASPHAIISDLEKLSLVNIDAAATALLEGDGRGHKDLTVSAAQALRFFLRARPAFEEKHIHVVNYGTAWRDKYFESCFAYAAGPLEEMSWDLKTERDRNKEHAKIRRSVLRLLPPTDTDTDTDLVIDA